jgi:hypothetical protein
MADWTRQQISISLEAKYASLGHGIEQFFFFFGTGTVGGTGYVCTNTNLNCIITLFNDVCV